MCAYEAFRHLRWRKKFGIPLINGNSAGVEFFPSKLSCPPRPCLPRWTLYLNFSSLAFRPNHFWCGVETPGHGMSHIDKKCLTVYFLGYRSLQKKITPKFFIHRNHDLLKSRGVSTLLTASAYFTCFRILTHNIPRDFIWHLFRVLLLNCAFPLLFVEISME